MGKRKRPVSIERPVRAYGEFGEAVFQYYEDCAYFFGCNIRGFEGHVKDGTVFEKDGLAVYFTDVRSEDFDRDKLVGRFYKGSAKFEQVVVGYGYIWGDRVVFCKRRRESREAPRAFPYSERNFVHG